MKYSKDYLNHKILTNMKKFKFCSPVLEVGCGTVSKSKITTVPPGPFGLYVPNAKIYSPTPFYSIIFYSCIAPML